MQAEPRPLFGKRAKGNSLGREQTPEGRLPAACPSGKGGRRRSAPLLDGPGTARRRVTGPRAWGRHVKAVNPAVGPALCQACPIAL